MKIYGLFIIDGILETPGTQNENDYSEIADILAESTINNPGQESSVKNQNKKRVILSVPY